MTGGGGERRDPFADLVRRLNRCNIERYLGVWRNRLSLTAKRAGGGPIRGWWCRSTRAPDGAALADAIQAGLVDHDRAGAGDAPPLRLPAPPTGTVPLRRRIASLFDPGDGDVAAPSHSVRGMR